MFLQIKILSIPIPSMGLVYLPTFGCFFGVDVGKYTSPIGSYGIEFQQSINLENKFSLCNCFLTCFFSSSSLGSAVSSGISCRQQNGAWNEWNREKTQLHPPGKKVPSSHWITSLNHLVMLFCVFLASNLVVELRPWKTTMEPKKWAKKTLKQFSSTLERKKPAIVVTKPSIGPESPVLEGAPKWSHGKKNGLTFHSTGCLIGIPGSLKWIYIIPIWLGSLIPYIPYTTTNHPPWLEIPSLIWNKWIIIDLKQLAAEKMTSRTIFVHFFQRRAMGSQQNSIGKSMIFPENLALKTSSTPKCWVLQTRFFFLKRKHWRAHCSKGSTPTQKGLPTKNPWFFPAIVHLSSIVFLFRIPRS